MYVPKNKFKGRFFKMKRNLIFALGFLLFFGFVTVNCSAQSSTNDQRIVGTWIYTGESYSYTLVFNVNGSGTFTVTGGNIPGEGTFTYGISLEGKIYFVFSQNNQRTISGDILYFSPDGRTLIFSGNVYRKK